MFFKYVKKGDQLEIPSAEFHNAVLSILNKETTFRRGTDDRTNAAGTQFKSPRRTIYLRANDNIEEYSIFTISKKDTVGSGSGEEITTGTGTGAGISDDMGYDPRFPKVFTKKVDDTIPSILVANKQQSLGQNGDYVLDILGVDTPSQVHYEGTVPEIGQIVGPKPGTYNVSVGYTGCICISGPDVTNSIIWIVKDVVSGPGLVELCAQETASRSVPYTALLGTWDADLHSWCYDGAPTVYAIDHRVGPPYAESGWKGLYQAMASNTYGTIYDCVSLDCELPDEGCACSGTGT